MKSDFKKIERKWQLRWEKEKLYQVDILKSVKPFYNLMMFPYPSAEGLHVGNMYAFTGSDIFGRYQKLKGYDVFEPIGLDGFGIHSENFAIKNKIHPAKMAIKTQKRFYEQLHMIGNAYDWSKTLETYDPNYYKWTQWLFLQMFKKGLAYKKLSVVNWCPSCKTVLSDEQVIVKSKVKNPAFAYASAGRQKSKVASKKSKINDAFYAGVCERCGTEVVKKAMNQWFLKITDYAEKLLKNIDKIDWTEKTKLAQKNWIGKSEGAEIKFGVKFFSNRISNTTNKISNALIEVFTTRPDTLLGCTYLVLSPEHKLLENLKFEIGNWNEVGDYIKKAKAKTDQERTNEKTGVELRGIKAINPANKKEIPIFVADYVLSGYGTGAIMAVPAHDERDFGFAKKNNLPIKQVIVSDLQDFNVTIKTLELLDKINKAASKLGIHVWVLGGLACAFYAGVIYRKHSDLDIIVKNNSDFNKIIELFRSIGWTKKREKKIDDELFSFIFDSDNNIEVEIAVNKYKFGLKESDFEMKKKKLGNFESLVLSKKYVEDFKKMQLKNRHEEKDKLDFDFLNGKCFVGDGYLINSEKFDGIKSNEAKQVITNFVQGKLKTNYKLRDWCISRQRFWGPPIPIIYCEQCGAVPVLEKDLPVMLPKTDDYLPDGTDRSPLARNSKFVNIKCPKCGGNAKRETDVSDTFLDSAWYFLRYPSIGNWKLEIGNWNKKKMMPWDKEITKKWLPVDMYIGGHEHAVLHLLYTRFVTMVLHDLGMVDFEEPFKKFRAHGLIIKDGAKMSKSKGNVVNPDDYIEKYGADVLRTYLMFIGPFKQGGDFRDEGVVGITRFLARILIVINKIITNRKKMKDISGESVLINKTIKVVTNDIENLNYNTAISSLMIQFNGLNGKPDWRGEMNNSTGEFEDNKCDFSALNNFVIMLSLFAPHLCEEIWQMLGNKESIFKAKWPEFDESKLKEDKIKLIIQVNGKVRSFVDVDVNISESKASEIAQKQENVMKFIAGKKIKKMIFVKGRLVNIVV